MRFSFLPTYHFYQCPGCDLSSARPICESCIQSVRLNSELLPSSAEGVEAFAPLLYSLAGAHRMVTRWKSQPGSALRRILFQIHPELLRKLKDERFEWIIPIPQSFERSWQRGHASAVSSAQFFSNQLKVPILQNRLTLKEKIPSRQAQLSLWERTHRMNPFEWRDLNLKRNTRVLLVDDLITSGKTLSLAAEVVHQSHEGIRITAASLSYRPRKSQRLREAQYRQNPAHALPSPTLQIVPARC